MTKFEESFQQNFRLNLRPNCHDVRKLNYNFVSQTFVQCVCITVSVNKFTYGIFRRYSLGFHRKFDEDIRAE